MREWLVAAIFPAWVGCLPAYCQDQGLAAQIRAGDAAAVGAAIEALDSPDPEQLPDLLHILNRGARLSGQRGVAAELAYAVMGWWSLQDSEVADRLFELFEAGDRSIPLQDAVRLGAIGATDSASRARRWIAAEDAVQRRNGWWLLRLTGAEAESVTKCVRDAIESDDEQDQCFGLELIWEFEIASESLTHRLEGLGQKAGRRLTRWAALWALARTGGFRTQWMLDHRKQLASRDDEQWFDRQFEYMVLAGAKRLAREMPMLAPADQPVVARWLGPHLFEPELRRIVLALDLDARLVRDLFARHLAMHALGAADTLPFWAGCLDAPPSLQRLACLGLAHIGETAAPHRQRIAALLAHERDPVNPLSPPLRASAIYALGAIGREAGDQPDAVAGFSSSEDPLVAAATNWALPRLRGEESPGPWRAVSSEPERVERMLTDLRKPSSHVLRSIPDWPRATRRLVLPRLLVSLLEVYPSLPPRYMALPLGEPDPMEMLDSVDTLMPATKTFSSPDRTAWPEQCALRAAAIESVGPPAKVALPLLRWLAPRRPHLPGLVRWMERL